MSDAAVMVWCKALCQYANGSALWRAFAAGCEEDRMPSLHRMRELLRGRQDTAAFVAPPPLTQEERDLSDQAAMLSCLWLHYAKGWELERVGSEIIGRLWAKQSGDPDIANRLKQAKEAYPREYVLNWMEEQQAMGN